MNWNTLLPCLLILIGIASFFFTNWICKKLAIPLKRLAALSALVFIAGVIWMGYSWIYILFISVALLGILQANKRRWIGRKLERFGINSKDLTIYFARGLVILAFALSVITKVQSDKTETETSSLLDSNNVLLDSNIVLLGSNKVLTEKLARFSGINNIYPQIIFTEPGGYWAGETKKIGSTIPIMFQNLSEDPIRDLKVTIVEVLELRKWNEQVHSEVFSGTSTNSHLEKDSGEKFIRPPYVEMEYYFNILYPGGYIDTVIAAPPTEGKNKYEYFIDVRTPNWRATYEYQFVMKPDNSFPRFNFRNFYMAYEIWKVNMETGTKEELIDKYREPGFPDS